MENTISLKLTIDGKDALATIKTADDDLKKLINDVGIIGEKSGEQTGKMCVSFANVRNVIQGVKEAFELFKNVFNEPLQLAIQKEGFETTLKVMLGSVEAARARMEEYTQFATITPFQLNQVVDLGNKLTAMGRYSIELMTDLGDLAAASGKPIEQVVGAFSKLSTGQIGAAKDMFRDLLINDNDWAEMLNEKGMTMTAENMISVLHDIMVKKGFAGMMGEMSKTTAGAISNMEDSISKMKTVFGGIIATGLRPFIESITQLTGMLYDFSPALAGVSVGLMSVGGAMLFANTMGIMPLIFNFGKMGEALTIARVQFALASMSGQGFAGSMTAAGIAVKGFFASLGPIGWAVIGITAITLAMQLFKSETENTNEALSEQEKKLMKERTELKELEKVLLDETATRDKKQRMLDEMNKKYPTLLSNIDLEKMKTGELKKVFSELNMEYERKIKLAAKERQLGDITEKSVGIEMELQEAEKLLAQTEKVGRRWDDIAGMWIEGDNELYVKRQERVEELKRQKDEFAKKWNEIMLQDIDKGGGKKEDAKKTLDWYSNEIKKLEEIQKQFDKVGAITEEARKNKAKIEQYKKEEEELKNLLFGGKNGRSKKEGVKDSGLQNTNDDLIEKRKIEEDDLKYKTELAKNIWEAEDERKKKYTEEYEKRLEDEYKAEVGLRDRINELTDNQIAIINNKYEEELEHYKDLLINKLIEKDKYDEIEILLEKEKNKRIQEAEEELWRKKNVAAMIGINAMKSGLNSLWQDNVMVSRETAGTWDKAWVTIENSALSSIGNILATELESLAVSALAHETTEAAKTGATATGVSVRQGFLLTEIVTTLTSAAANILNAIAIGIASLVEFLGPFGFLAVPAMVAGILGVYSGVKCVLGFAEGGMLPKGKSGFVEGWHNEIIAPERTFVDVMNSNIIPQLSLQSSGGLSVKMIERFERAIERFERKQFKLRGVDLVMSGERIAINTI